MTPPRRQTRFRQPPGRPQPRNLKSGNAYLVVTEGQKTEPHYFIELRNRLRLSSTDVEVTHADGTDALSIVNYAIQLRDKRSRAARKNIALPKYDEAWAVFDTERADTNPHLHDALQLAEARSIRVALSNPAFEYWILLHYEYTTAAFADCYEVIGRIQDNGFIAHYQKGATPVGEILERVRDGVRHARRCRQQHEGHQQQAQQFWNPCTQVDELVTALNDATREHLRLQLD